MHLGQPLWLVGAIYETLNSVIRRWVGCGCLMLAACDGSITAENGDPGPTVGSTQATTVGSGGSGANSSGTGLGGALPCTDTVVTEPLQLSNEMSFYDPVIAAVPGSEDFAIAWLGTSTVYVGSALTTTVVAPTGRTQVPPFSPGVSQGRTALAARESGYAVGRIVGQAVWVDRITYAGAVTSSSQAAASDLFVELAATPNGYFATVFNESDHTLLGSFLPDGTMSFNMQVAYPTPAACCAERYWKTFPLSNGGVGALWSDVATEYATFDSSGLFQTHQTITEITGIASYSAPHGDRLLVGNHFEVHELDNAGMVHASHDVDLGGPMTVTSNGSAARIAVGGPYGTDWYQLSLDGTEPRLMLRLDPDGWGPLSAAWNGSGWGLTWTSSDGVMFAYIEPCTP